MKPTPSNYEFLSEAGLSCSEAAKVLGCHSSTVRRNSKAWDIPFRAGSAEFTFPYSLLHIRTIKHLSPYLLIWEKAGIGKGSVAKALKAPTHRVIFMTDQARGR